MWREAMNAKYGNVTTKILILSSSLSMMTRTDDNGLYKANDSNKKVRRHEKPSGNYRGAKPALAVSIRQNSYPDDAQHTHKLRLPNTMTIASTELSRF